MAKEVSLDKIRNRSTFFARSEEHFTAHSKKHVFLIKHSLKIGIEE